MHSTVLTLAYLPIGFTVNHLTLLLLREKFPGFFLLWIAVKRRQVLLVTSHAYRFQEPYKENGKENYRPVYYRLEMQNGKGGGNLFRRHFSLDDFGILKLLIFYPISVLVLSFF